MARKWTTGFELQSASDGVEWSQGFGTPAISTTVKHSGSASFRANPTSATAYFRKNGIEAVFPIATAQNGYIRFYLRIASAPDAQCTIIRVLDDGGTVKVSMRLNTDRTLELWENSSPAQIGSDSPALDIDTWYRIEIAIVSSNINRFTDISARIDGVDFAAASGLSISYSTGDIRLDIGATSVCTTDLYFDDVAVNDSSGSNETSYPGEGHVICLRPDGNGDNVGMGSRGGTDSGADWSQVDEVTPDDATTYYILPDNNDILEVTVEDPVGAGIGTGDTVKFVQVLSRQRAATSSVMGYNNRIKSASGATVLETNDLGGSSTNWITEDRPGRNAVAYVDPTTGSAWTVTGTNSLSNMQIGQRARDAAPDVWLTALWAMVEYVPSSGGVTVNAATQSIAASIAAIGIVTGALLAPSVQAATFSVPPATVAIVENVTVTPSAQALSAFLPSATVAISETVSAGSQAASFSVPPATITAVQNVTVSASAQVLTLSVPSATVSTQQNADVSANAQVVTFSVPAPTVTGIQNVTVSASPQVLTASLPVASVRVSETVLAAVQTATFSIPSASVTGSASVPASVQTLTLSVPAYTVVAQEEAADPEFGMYYGSIGYGQAAFGGFVAPVQGSAIVSAAVQSLSFTIPAPTVTAVQNVTVAPSGQSVTFSVPPATAVVSVDVSAGVQVLTVSVPPYTVQAETGITVSPSAQLLTASLPAPTVSTGVVVSASPVSATFVANAPVVASGAAISPSPLTLTFSVPAYTLPMWSQVPRAGDETWSEEDRNSNADYNAVSRASDATYAEVARASDSSYNAVPRASDDDWSVINRNE